MKLFLSVMCCFFLLSCTKIYVETYTIERYPVEWTEDLVVDGHHQHFEQEDCSWTCVYIEKDTLCWTHYDTIVVNTFQKIERIK
jgi:hypothetical protein